MNRLKTCLMIAIAGLFSVSGAFADSGSRLLKGDIVVYGTTVTVADFIENAGVLGPKPLFRSPDIGHRGSVPVWLVLERLETLGIADVDTGGLVTVDVTRASQYLTGADFLAMAKAALSERMGNVSLEDMDVTVDGLPEALHADPQTADPIILRRLAYSSRSGRFQASFSVDDGNRRRDVVMRGSARETRRAVVLNRPIGRGDIIQERDVTERRMNVRQVNEGSAVTADQLIGMEARRNLRENAAVNLSDVRLPTLVERNQPVRIVYRTRTMALSAQGTALADGATGDLITVRNFQSNRIVQARVTGAGEVIVAPRTLRLATATE
ncbi:MAG: flagellar basal body P-ring formation chaperone FlgA [Pseudomonadota bacterium]